MLASNMLDNSSDEDCKNLASIKYESKKGDNLEESDSKNDAALTAKGWKKVPYIFSDNRPNPIDSLLRNYPGVNPDIGFDANMSIMECFSKFVTKDIIEYLVFCINDKAKHFFDNNSDKRGIINRLKWKNVNCEEIYTFLALYFYSGLCKLNEMNEYWSRSPIHPGVHFYCSSIMSRDRYNSIMKFLRFSEVKDVSKNDASTRLNKFVDKLTKMSIRNVDPGKHIAIDEAVVLYNGRLGFRQFIKSKHTKFDTKLIVMCNSENEWTGYNSNFVLSFGNESWNLPSSANANHLSSSERLVIYLAEHALDQGRHLTTNNWCSSLSLARYLETRKTAMTGITVSNKGIPKDLTSEKLQKHEFSCMRNNNILVVRWQDKESINIITTKYNAGYVEGGNKSFDGTKNAFKKPFQIEKYNEHMGGLDKADQLLEPHDPNRKPLAWFKKLGLHLLFRFVFNSYIVYRNISTNKQILFKSYIAKLVEQILLTHNDQAQSVWDKYNATHLPHSAWKRPSGPEGEIHTLVDLKPIPGSCDSRPRKRCRICYPTVRKTRKVCIGCTEQPGLCSLEHFREWHVRLETEQEQQENAEVTCPR